MVLPLLLLTAVTVSGRVVDERGRPVRFAVVNAIGGTVFGSETNERGEYRISAPPGQYRLRAWARTGPPTASPACETCCRAATGFAPAYYPLVVEPGRPLTGVEIRLRRTAVYCARGEVRNRAGGLAKDAALGLRNEEIGESAGVITDGGRFLLTNLAPGAYTLVVTDRPKLGRVVAERRFRIVDSNLDQLVIRE